MTAYIHQMKQVVCQPIKVSINAIWSFWDSSQKTATPLLHNSILLTVQLPDDEYMLGTTEMTYNEAQQLCADIGGQLAVPDSDIEFQLLQLNLV